MSKIKMLRKEAQVALPNSGETYVAEDGTVSMVLEDNYEPDHEASEQEVKEYAEWLGMKLPEDEELMWIAKEGLKAPLPKEWKPCKTDTGEVYYFNFKTGDSIWDHPMDEHFKSKFAQEKERLKKKKELEKKGVIVSDVPEPLAKLGQQRSNLVLSESGALEPVAQPSASFNLDSPRLEKKSSSGSMAAASSSFDKKPSLSDVKKSGSKANERQASPIKTTASAMPQVTSVVSSSTKAEKTEKKEKKDKKGKTSPAAEDEPAKRVELSTPVASPTTTPTTTTAAPTSGFGASSSLGLGTNRLMSEAEKNLQDRVRAEVEAMHKDEVASLESAYQRKVRLLNEEHEDAIGDINRDINNKKRRAIAEIEDGLQDEAEQSQKSAEARNRLEIQRLEGEVESLREKLNQVQTSAQHRLQEEGGRLGGDVEAQVAQRVAAVESEIADIRRRHAEAQSQRTDQERHRLEADLDMAISTAKDSSAKDFETRVAALRQQHEARTRELSEQADRDMADESIRTSKAAEAGGADGAIADVKARSERSVAAIRADGGANAAKITSDGDVELGQLQAAHAAELAGLRRAGTQSAGVAPAVANSIESDSEKRISAMKATVDASTTQRMAELAAERQKRLAATGSSSSGASSAANPDALRSTLRGELENEVLALETSLNTDETKEKQRLMAAKATEVATYTAEMEGQRRSALAEHIAAVQKRRSAAQESATREVDAAKAERERQLKSRKASAEAKKLAANSAAQAAQAAASQHAASSDAAATSTATSEAVSAVRADLDAEHSRAMRTVRNENETLLSDAVNALADELAAYERAERDQRDAALIDATPEPSPTSSPAASLNANAIAEAAAVEAHKEEVKSINDRYRRQVQTARTEYEARLTALRSQLSGEPEDHRSQVSALQSAHDATIASLKAQLQDSLLRQQQQQSVAYRNLGTPPTGPTPVSTPQPHSDGEQYRAQPQQYQQQPLSRNATPNSRGPSPATGGPGGQIHSGHSSLQSSPMRSHGGGGDPQQHRLADAIIRLDEKLDMLFNKVASMEARGGGGPNDSFADERRAGRRGRDRLASGGASGRRRSGSGRARDGKRSSSANGRYVDAGSFGQQQGDGAGEGLLRKWGGILDELETSRDQQRGAMTDAMRRYVYRDDSFETSF